MICAPSCWTRQLLRLPTCLIGMIHFCWCSLSCELTWQTCRLHWKCPLRSTLLSSSTPWWGDEHLAKPKGPPSRRMGCAALVLWFSFGFVVFFWFGGFLLLRHCNPAQRGSLKFLLLLQRLWVKKSNHSLRVIVRKHWRLRIRTKCFSFRGVFFNLQQVEIQELLLSTRKPRNNSSFL